MTKHIRPIGDTTQYLTSGSIGEDHEIPEGYELVDGSPPVGAEQIRIKTPIEQLAEVFKALPIADQITYSGAFALAEHYHKSGDDASILEILEAITPGPGNEDVKASMLAVLEGWV